MDGGESPCGCDTDQFPNKLGDTARAMYTMQRGSGS
jgi:xylose isomerase